MFNKDILGFLILVAGAFGGTLLNCFSKRSRDVFFVIMVFLAPMTENWDVNFVSRDWYRGTLRGFEFSLVDVLSVSLLLSALIAPRQGEKRFYWPASLGIMLIFYAYAVVNVAFSDPMLFGLFELSKMIRGLVIFLAAALYVRSERELRLLVAALAAVACYEGYLALKQRYYYGVHRVYGTIDDSNSLSVFFCTVAPVLVAAFNARWSRYLKAICAVGIALACVGVVLTISRAGVVILAAVLLGTALTTMSYQFSARKLAIMLVVILGAAGITAKSWQTLGERFKESSLQDEYGNKKNLGRGYYIRIAKAIAQDRLLGVGLNNWSYWVSNHYGPALGYRFVPYVGTDREPSSRIPENSNIDEAQAAPAHSLGALTLGELGIPGFILFGFVWMRWFHVGSVFLWRKSFDPMRQIGVGILFGFSGMFLQSLTEWVFRQSPLYYVFHILLGALAALYYHKRQQKRLARRALEAQQQWSERVFAPESGPLQESVLTSSARGT